jgi:hypothetical protein
MHLHMEEKDSGGRKLMARMYVSVCFLALALTVLSCKSNLLDSGETIGDTVVEIQFDLLGYLDESQQSLEYGDDPRIPGGGGTTEITTPANTVDIAGEIGNVKSIERVNLFLDYRLDNDTGWADVEYVVYLSEIGQDPFSVPGIASDRVELRPGASSLCGLSIAADERVRALFEKQQFQYAAKLIIETKDDSGDIRGEATIESFIADVVFTL